MSSGQRPIATVFGGSGFLARYIVRRLADQGYQVRAASRHPSAARHLLPMGDVGQIERLYAPVQEADKVALALRDAQLVINTVGILAPSGRDQNFDTTMHRGAQTVAQAAAQAGASRLIHVSAIGASHQGPSDYARAKADGEDAVRTAFPGATILRPSIVFGAQDQFFNRFAAMPAIPLIGGGHTLFQPVYVDDVAAAAQRCWQAPGGDTSAGKTFELGGPEVLSFRDCMELMLDVIGQRRPLVPMPWGIAEILGAIGDALPFGPITSDQVKSLGVDNVVADDALGFADLGLVPTDLRSILPTYLNTYTPGGALARFSQS